ncbi:MAG TPA: biopolymer transporter ExbD, partial [Accumulibacter sp.]|nr:biopolymer transporter ExbD [Accumulibacter sp.]
MNFRRGRGRDEPEINLIPFIDILLVIIIFLMMTTTYAKYSGLE